jgi:ribulose-5-phosphate 4-epimerase/fuculose-1-phosphate aldolase
MKNNNRDGNIKFICDWNKCPPVISDDELIKLNTWRDILYDLNLIGATPDGTGFGNISLRTKPSTRFIISGSSTGNLEKLNAEHYVKVTDYSISNNMVNCSGPVKASSESLTHAVIYEFHPEINGIIHIHSLAFWKKLLNKVPTTSEKVEYGTPEMAIEVTRLFKETDAFEKKIIVMGGHKEGLITFGKDLDEAGKYLLAYINIMVHPEN